MRSPDLRLLLAYRLLGWRLGPDYREWTYRDITGQGYLLRQGLPLLVVFGTLLGGLLVASGTPVAQAVVPVIGVLVVLVLLRRTVVERALRQQGLDRDGAVDPAAQDWYDDPEQRRRRSLAGATATLLLVVAALVLLGRGTG